MQAQAGGNLYIISAPSGAGKSTLLTRLVNEEAKVVYSISHTTRAPRQGEVDGEHYHFTTREAFEKLIGEDVFLEWAEVHGNYYGTSCEPVLAQLERGFDVIMDIDVAGAAIVRGKLPEAIGIFILPPDRETLAKRLTGRGKDAPETIVKRMHNAYHEIRRVDEFDYVLVNDDLDACYRQLQSVVAASRLQRRVNRGKIAKIVATFENQD